MKNIYKAYLLSFFLLCDFIAFAQPSSDDGTGGLEGDDTPAASINTKLIYLALIGVVFVFYSFKKRVSK